MSFPDFDLFFIDHYYLFVLGVNHSVFYCLSKPFLRLVDSNDRGEGGLKELFAKKDADNGVGVGKGFGQHGGKQQDNKGQ